MYFLYYYSSVKIDKNKGNSPCRFPGDLSRINKGKQRDRSVAMKYLIAIDGGGTKTESVLFTDGGQVLLRDITQGVNGLDVGIEIAQQRVIGAMERLCEAIPGGKAPDSVYGGLAASVDYFPNVMYEFIKPRFKDSAVRLEGDGGSLIAAMQGHSDGASLIAGTGSSLYIRSDDILRRYGGWGPLIDTEGSGYKLGIHAFYAAFRSLDGRGPKSVLYDLIAEQMGGKPEDHLPDIYAKGRPYISTFARCVFEARKMGDAAAQSIFDHGVKCLAELVEIGERIMDKEFNVYTGGGLFTCYPEYWEALCEEVPERAKLIPLNANPIYGAAVEALWNIGATADGSFRQTFTSSYDKSVEAQNRACGGNALDFDVLYGV